jgi:5-hydroxyisourate hydrolase
MSISTHILDTSRGKPAAAVGVQLALREGDALRVVGRGVTDADGRCKTLLAPGPLAVGIYRLSFDVAAYFAAQSLETFYPTVDIHFEVKDPEGHYHVPLLLSPWGYSTYRGS